MGFQSLLGLADRAVLQHLGGPVRYVPGSGSPVDVRGIFDAAFVRVDSGGQVAVASSGPAVFVRLSDLPGEPEADRAATVEVNGVTYRVREAKRDGQGGVVLILHRV